MNQEPLSIEMLQKQDLLRKNNLTMILLIVSGAIGIIVLSTLSQEYFSSLVIAVCVIVGSIISFYFQKKEIAIQIVPYILNAATFICFFMITLTNASVTSTLLPFFMLAIAA